MKTYWTETSVNYKTLLNFKHSLLIYNITSVPRKSFVHNRCRDQTVQARIEQQGPELL